MPYSNPVFDQIVKNFIKRHKFTNYLDIGIGSGKYGKIIKNIFPKAKVFGVEVDKSYIKQFNLKKIYDGVYNEKIETFINNRPDFITELAIIGDCIEHLKKSNGLNLIHFLVYRCKYILIVFPSKYIQYSWQGHTSEAHMSVWDEKDFEQFDYKFKKKKFINLVVIRGYLSDPAAIVES